ncbi:MAG: photosynthetic/respiratory NAD(P)H-quinone oxidoreductase subunit C [Thermoleophilia bacterium]
MQHPYLSDVVFLLGFGTAAVLLPLLPLLVFRWIRPTNPNPVKSEPYESGMVQATAPRRPFHMRYYNFAIVFIVFEVETVLLFAVAPVLRDLGWIDALKAAIFVILVVDGLFYAWRKGALVWR